MTTFPDLGLAEPLLRALTSEGFVTPTPIQRDVIPALRAGRDVLGTAQTGTGKTAAFVLPILDRLLAAPRRPAPKGCRALVLAPTRELAAQIAETVAVCARHTRVSSAVVVGGVKPGPQVRALARGVDVLIATPGRLEDHVRNGDLSLGGVEVLVLDEADQMLDLGFIPAIRRILARLPAQRQAALLSATMPTEIRRLAREFLADPAEIAVAPVSRPVEAIDQSVRFVEAAEKRAALARLVAAPDVASAIVFTRTKRGADRVCQHLTEAGCDAVAIHGNKSQNQRDRALGAFRGGQARVLVATDIAARGIDVSGVSHVFNYELPNVPEAYVHRIGRTARAGRSGVAVSLCDPSERKLLKDIEKLIGRPLGGGGGGSAPERPARSRQAAGTADGPAGIQRDGPRGADGAARRRPRRSRRRAPAAAVGAGAV